MNVQLGFDLGIANKNLAKSLLICTTEIHNLADLKLFIEVLHKAIDHAKNQLRS